jgi:DNA-binding beta-propeller fold protein YncE
MDELSLRALLERATSPEPPLGHLVSNSMRAGRRLRRRRRGTGAALSAAAIVAVSTVPVLMSGAGHRVSKPEPAVVPVPPADASTAYVATTANTVVPISLATNTAGTPIRVPEELPASLDTMAAATPDGRTVYEVGMNPDVGATVTPIDTATKTAGPTITIAKAEPQHFAVAPNGKTAYLSASGGLFRISTATNTASKAPNCSRFGCGAIAFTPNGKVLYVINGGAKTVIVMRTASNSVLTSIKIPANSPGIPFNIGITPNGKTAYVVDGRFQAKPGENSVVPINLATNRALAPIKIWASGMADGLVIAPDGRTAYVLSSRAVTPIDTATNKAEPAINLPETAGYAYSMALTPNGKTIYVLTPRGVVPIRTASRTVLRRIGVPKLDLFTQLAITPDGRTIYVGARITRPRMYRGHKLQQTVGGGVVPISTATNTAGRFINLGGTVAAITFAP